MKAQARLLSLLLTVLFFIPHSFGAATITVNKDFNKREIKVRLGGMIRVNLEQQGAAGYSWNVRNPDAEHLEVVEEKTDSTPPPADVTGAPVQRTWLFRAKKTGRSELRLMHYRVWEGEESASDSFLLKVLIIP